MSAHTPGPWLADVGQGVGGACQHAQWVGVGPQGDALGRGFDVALVEKDADARLIAAAPDLLAALETLTSAFEQVSHDAPSGLVEVILFQARAAIAKAVGK